MTSIELKRFRRNTYRVVVAILIIFGVTGVIGAVIGKYLDNEFNTFPRYTAISMALSYIVGWGLSYLIKRSHDKQIQIIENTENN